MSGLRLGRELAGPSLPPSLSVSPARSRSLNHGRNRQKSDRRRECWGHIGGTRRSHLAKEISCCGGPFSINVLRRLEAWNDLSCFRPIKNRFRLSLIAHRLLWWRPGGSEMLTPESHGVFTGDPNRARHQLVATFKEKSSEMSPEAAGADMAYESSL